MKTERGQVIIIVGFLLVVILLLFAVLIDGARLFVEQQEINRALDAAGKAALIVVGDHMVTQVVEAQTAAASITPSATPSGGIPGPTPTETPAADDLYAWLTDEHRQTLVAPPMQTVVATHVLGSLGENSLGLDNPNVIDIGISYPDNYHPDDQTLGIRLDLDRRVVIIFGKILNLNQGVLSGSSKQTIPQH
jgi:type II secretory pathway pseudopilin PulG